MNVYVVVMINLIIYINQILNDLYCIFTHSDTDGYK